jgi:hypothetical protein
VPSTRDTSVIDSATSRPCLTRKVEQQIGRRGIKKEERNMPSVMLFSLPFAKTLSRTHSFEQFHPHPHVCDDGRSSNAKTKGGKKAQRRHEEERMARPLDDALHALREICTCIYKGEE